MTLQEGQRGMTGFRPWSQWLRKVISQNYFHLPKSSLSVYWLCPLAGPSWVISLSLPYMAMPRVPEETPPAVPLCRSVQVFPQAPYRSSLMSHSPEPSSTPPLNHLPRRLGSLWWAGTRLLGIGNTITLPWILWERNLGLPQQVKGVSVAWAAPIQVPPQLSAGVEGSKHRHSIFGA